MDIKWFGQACFFIKTKTRKNEEVRIVIDPFSKEIGLKPPSLEADILLITHHHYDHNNTEAVGGDYFLIDQPGEYEVKNIFIKGVQSFHDSQQGKERGFNTIYVIEAYDEELRVCHLGDLGQKELTPEQLEALGEIDILLIPVGGVYTIDAKTAHKIVTQIEPKIVIPMHYALPKLKIQLDGVKPFLKLFAQEKIEPQARLTIKREKLPQEIQIVLLKP